MQRSLKTTRKRTRQSGFGLLEIVVTVFLVVIGLLVVMTSYLAIARAQRYSLRMDTATEIATRELERIRNRPWTAIANETGALGEYPDQPDYRHTVGVRTIGTVKEVTLRVYFEHNRRHAEMMTYVANL
jgi:Tfp pilus assembly protein PilV